MIDNTDAKGFPIASAKALNDGYNQTYVILKNTSEDEKKSEKDNDVFFRCGNWCYIGQIQFSGLKIGVADLSLLIPILQKQQGSLRYYCNSINVPTSSVYSDPLQFLRAATEFVAEEMTSLSIERELKKMSSVFPWIDADGATTYFELSMSDVPHYMEKVGLVASKTYSRGLIIISIHTENVFYFVIQNGEGDQPLLDVHFPDVSKHGQGLQLQSYNDPSYSWRKLTLWHVLNCSPRSEAQRLIPKIRTVNISSSNYQQTYCVMKSTFDASVPVQSLHHDVLFRFGSWCYSGRVQLTPALTLADVPFVIPALRLQQGRLDYYCDVCSIPANSPFVKSLEYMQQLGPLIEDQITNSEEVLRGLISRLSKMGLSETVVNWLEGDPSNSFFEFKIALDERTEDHFSGIEIIASKCYHASGVITITVMFEHTIYVTVLDGDRENPLLDSSFPDVSGKGRGYQIQAYAEGTPEWPELRKVSIWQTVGALEQEFRDRVVVLSQMKSHRSLEEGVEEACEVPGNDLNINRINLHNSDVSAVNAMEGKRDSLTLSVSSDSASSSGFVGSSISTFPHDSDSSAPDVAEAKESPDKNYAGKTSLMSKMSTADVSLDEGRRRSLAAKEDSHTTTHSHSHTHALKGNKDSAPSALDGPLGIGTGTGTREELKNPQAYPDSLAELKGTGSASALTSTSSVARPHHIPKLQDSLGRRMDEIRKNMEGGACDAPWDSRGRPLNAAPLSLSRNSLSSPMHVGEK